MNKQKNIKLILEYDGTRYHGWQRQKNGSTIQDEIEKRIHMMTGESVKLIASGRTDAGVHALNQVCNFMSTSKIPPESFERGLNSLLPDDIHIKGAEYGHFDFHSRYSSKSKIYEYRILNRNQPDVFLRYYSWHIQRKLDGPAMEKCCSLLMGKHDFSAFKSSGSKNVNPVREMMRAELHSLNDGVLCFLFEADGFLRHMARNIVGTVVEVGRGRMDFNEFRRILQSGDRRMAGIKAPPQGLFLKMVRY